MAGPADWQSIIDIYNQGIDDGCNAFTRHISVDSMKSWLEAHDGVEHAFFVAETGSKVVGWISLSPYRKERKAFRKTAETSYYIDRQFRNRGVGGKLMQFLLEKALDYNIEALIAFLLDTNAASVTLLEKHGFQQWGHFPKIAETGNGRCGQFVYGTNLK
ncbi:GNAT family N-acetyltransferase [Bacteroidota bacterium]